ncbi:PEP-CTERM sorting domain-containing protein [Rhodoferax sp.]|uniref:PEP-CTERM sorting domain-containing protein n=1 Tax=Rhodoferax sp. TaxID=50421 RepID=UPI001ED43F8D|nr:PEP-CTERM sorting domain-containing protein [Rhodoferax sp.]MBT9505755.1 PEP-CTERM sorting domain-containing protein [Rhodoferax sp.]
MKFRLPHLILALSAALIACAAQAAPIVADGNMADWGIQANGTVAGWTPTQNAGILYVVEDQNNANSGYLSPGWGGQAYDAEAMYLTWGKNTQGVMSLFLGMVTGHNPNTATGSNSYGRGDFAIDFGRDGSWEFGVLTKDRSATLKQGDIVSTTNANWAKGLWSSPGVLANSQNPSPYVTHVNTGADVGNAKVAWTQISGAMGVLGGSHWFYEAEIPVSAFGNYWSGDNPTKSFDVQWTMDCANDIITLDPPVSKVPEPASAALVLLGAGLLGAQRRRKAQQG